MFKNKILVKATGSSSSSSSSPLFLLPLSLRSSSSSPSSSSPPPESESDPSLSIQLEALCWKLSRRWGLACLPQPSQILLLYRKSQLDSVDRVVSEFIKLDPAINVGTEEEVKSGALNANAIEFGLKCLMLDHKWSCIRDSVFVESNFDSNQERTNLCALNVEVQCGACDEFVFVVSPDTLRFNRHKISDLINSQNMEILEKNKEVNFESYDYSTACTTLPFLYEGYIRGLSKVLPEGESFDLIQDLWSIKHGLNLQSSYFIAVQNSNGSCINKQWLPCSYVIQGSGLSAAPKSIRESKAKSAYQSFIKILQAWNFFGDGPLIVTEQSVIGNVSILPAWEKAATTNHVPPPGVSLQTHDDSIFNHLLSSLDFRASKPDLGFTNIMSKDNSIT
ncbi:hypothetical protein LUZ60_006154 [Juncus effusus]|nr:hypothetical protein LUZ60_006154 [Juncus effusus]